MICKKSQRLSLFSVLKRVFLPAKLEHYIIDERNDKGVREYEY